MKVANGQQLQGYSVQLVQHQGSVKGKGFFLVCCLCVYVHLFLNPGNPCIADQWLHSKLSLCNHSCSGAREIDLGPACL